MLSTGLPGQLCLVWDVRDVHSTHSNWECRTHYQSCCSFFDTKKDLFFQYFALLFSPFNYSDLPNVEFFVWGEDFQKYLMENMSKLSSKFDPDFQIISNVKLEIGEFQCPTTSFPCDPVTFESLSL
eukprot:TRINITY_DN11601_c0_g2_i2.p1 TRINITY_DN11601_c0_g2~~TRINITY_DN11601_c0_g2_i2.p1  ORF type:complete len:126 (+),score=21.40 TRINITY_DN11601_c0_g2_i2:281-658(+)